MKNEINEIRKHFITSRKSHYTEGEVTVFLQTFEVVRKVRKADLIMSALGVYEVELDGNKIGDQYFAPGYTYYPRDLFYQKYSLGNELNKGCHELKVYLGQGWYSGRFTHENKTKIYGDNTAVSWQLILEYEDGETEIIVSDSNVIELQSQYIYAGFYDGEILDSRIEEKTIGFATEFKGSIPENLSETFLMVKLQEQISTKKIIIMGDKTIIDFGQNFAGVVLVNMGLIKANSKIKIRHGEMLDKQGELYTANLRKAKAETVVWSNGKDWWYRPRFTYMGFRYIEITGVAYEEDIVIARSLYSDMTRTGYFTSKNKEITQLFNNQLWGQKSNYIEIPTDCPQRDERMGYTGDGQVYAWTGSYNFNTEDFWKKFFKDIAYSQIDNVEDYVAPTIPATGKGGIGFLNMLGWGNAITIIPEMIFWQYGSDQLQHDYYNCMKKFVDCELRHLKNGVWLAPNLGDWLMPGKDMAWMATNNGPVSNSFIVNDLRIISSLAKRLGYDCDYEYYYDKYLKSNSSYINTFINEDGTVTGDYQGAYVLALQYVQIPDELRSRVEERFIEHVKKNGLKTGFFSTEYLLPTLVELNQVDLAFDILLNDNCPGWMYQVKNGATTIWERWDAIKQDGSINDEEVEQSNENMVSFNHYAFGSVGRFYYQYILGIKPLEPGYTKIQIKPIIDPRLKEVKGEYHSVAGLIKSSWKYLDDNQIQFNISTPKEATIILPNGDKYDVKPGEYTFVAY